MALDVKFSVCKPALIGFTMSMKMTSALSSVACLSSCGAACRVVHFNDRSRGGGDSDMSATVGGERSLYALASSL